MRGKKLRKMQKSLSTTSDTKVLRTVQLLGQPAGVSNSCGTLPTLRDPLLQWWAWGGGESCKEENEAPSTFVITNVRSPNR